MSANRIRLFANYITAFCKGYRHLYTQVHRNSPLLVVNKTYWKYWRKQHFVLLLPNKCHAYGFNKAKYLYRRFSDGRVLNQTAVPHDVRGRNHCAEPVTDDTDKPHESDASATWRLTLKELQSMGCSLDDILTNHKILHVRDLDKRVEFLKSHGIRKISVELLKIATPGKPKLFQQRLHKLNRKQRNLVDLQLIKRSFNLTSEELLELFMLKKSTSSALKIQERIEVLHKFGFTLEQIQSCVNVVLTPQCDVAELQLRIKRLVAISTLRQTNLKVLNYSKKRFENYLERLSIDKRLQTKTGTSKVAKKNVRQRDEGHNTASEWEKACQKLNSIGIPREEILLHPQILQMDNVDELIHVVRSNGVETVTVPLLKIAATHPRRFKAYWKYYKKHNEEKDVQYMASLRHVKQRLGLTWDEFIAAVLTKKGVRKRYSSLRDKVETLLGHGFTPEEIRSNFDMLIKPEKYGFNLAKVALVMELGFTCKDVLNCKEIFSYKLQDIDRAYEELKEVHISTITLKLLCKQASLVVGNGKKRGNRRGPVSFLRELGWDPNEVTLTPHERDMFLARDVVTIQHNYRFLLKKGFQTEHIQALPLVLGHESDILENAWKTLQERNDPKWSADKLKLLNILQYRIEFPEK